MRRWAIVPLALENNIISRVWQEIVTESDRQAELNTYDFRVEIPELRFGVSEIAFGLSVIRGLRVHVDGRTSYRCERRNTAANVSYASPRRVLGGRWHRGVSGPGVVSGGVGGRRDVSDDGKRAPVLLWRRSRQTCAMTARIGSLLDLVETRALSRRQTRRHARTRGHNLCGGDRL